jgi:hypothetical protein
VQGDLATRKALWAESAAPGAVFFGKVTSLQNNLFKYLLLLGIIHWQPVVVEHGSERIMSLVLAR